MIEINKIYTTTLGTIYKPVEVILEKSNGYKIFKVEVVYKNTKRIKELHELHLIEIINR